MPARTEGRGGSRPPVGLGIAGGPLNAFWHFINSGYYGRHPDTNGGQVETPTQPAQPAQQPTNYGSEYDNFSLPPGSGAGSVSPEAGQWHPIVGPNGTMIPNQVMPRIDQGNIVTDSYTGQPIQNQVLPNPNRIVATDTPTGGGLGAFLAHLFSGGGSPSLHQNINGSVTGYSQRMNDLQQMAAGDFLSQLGGPRDNQMARQPV